MRAAARWCDDAANLLLGVKFWQYASVALRWASAAILKAAKGFSGWRNSQAGTALQAALKARRAKQPPTPPLTTTPSLHTYISGNACCCAKFNIASGIPAAV